MRIVLTGGGTGGHLTPLVAIADKLKSKLGSDVLAQAQKWRKRL
ncbi:MAG: hypothetical protein US82_C0019G0002 [Parcubacteria group bacterium GW2011_GWC1_38_22]|nr:MAG: hypothetical protein US82_C0019G0002 [Parcubacteria group bacterium GW2011_GWC1_38_22]